MRSYQHWTTRVAGAADAISEIRDIGMADIPPSKSSAMIRQLVRMTQTRQSPRAPLPVCSPALEYDLVIQERNRAAQVEETPG